MRSWLWLKWLAGVLAWGGLLFLADAWADERAESELYCLSATIYYEAGTESIEGQLAVGHVVLNRFETQDSYQSLCDVALKKRGSVCQFSWYCEAERRKAWRDPAGWKRSVAIACDILEARTDRHDFSATHYHATNLSPDWARDMKELATIGGHVFYHANRLRVRRYLDDKANVISDLCDRGDADAEGSALGLLRFDQENHLPASLSKGLLDGN